MISAFVYGSLSIEAGSDEQGFKTLEDTIRRACVHCYAVEGQYPPNLQYLEEHYGLNINSDKYTVYYYQVSSNLMPDITVLKAAGGDTGR